MACQGQAGPVSVEAFMIHAHACPFPNCQLLGTWFPSPVCLNRLIRPTICTEKFYFINRIYIMFSLDFLIDPVKTDFRPSYDIF